MSKPLNLKYFLVLNDKGHVHRIEEFNDYAAAEKARTDALQHGYSGTVYMASSREALGITVGDSRGPALVDEMDYRGLDT